MGITGTIDVERRASGTPDVVMTQPAPENN